MRKYSFEEFDYYENRGEYAVRAYTRSGKGDFVSFVDTLEEAEKIRTAHGLSIGLEPEPTYKDFAYYPTIWKWGKSELTNEPCYQRVEGY